MRLMLPVLVAQRLRMDARQRHFYRDRYGVVVGLALIYAWALAAPQAPLSWPHRAHQAFLSVAQAEVVICALAGLRHFVEWPWTEHLEGTRELLLQTEVRNWEWLAGGCFAKAVAATSELLPVLPFMALSHGLGGISLAEGVSALVLLLSTSVIAGAAGLLGAAWSHHPREAFYRAIGSLFLILAWMPLAISWVASIMPSAFTRAWISCPPSPLCLFMLEGHLPAAEIPARFYVIAATHALLGIGMLILACPRLAARPWPSLPRAISIPGPHILNRWLPAWLCLLVPVLLCGLARHNRMAMGYALAALATMHLAFKTMLAMAAASRLHAERENGNLALELGTSHSAGETFARHFRALWSGSQTPRWTLAGGNLFALVLVIISPVCALEEKLLLSAVLMAGCGELWIDARALAWQAMLSGTRQANANQAVLSALGKVILLPWLAVWGFHLLYTGTYLDTSEMAALFICHTAMSMGASLAWTRSARNRSLLVNGN